MGLNYKKIKPNSLPEVIFGMYSRHIEKVYNHTYTPVQASIVEGIKHNSCFSFSAPTSTGKSFVFRNIIYEAEHDVVIVVPSRALINEYYITLCNLIKEKNVNILAFIDKINTKKSNRNVFIVTPERCKELFKRRDEFNIDFFLFDEAQLSNEKSFRGLFFDSIIRRAQKSYPKTKFIFAHPFVENPDAQIQKNHFDQSVSEASCYSYKNVGQIFYAYDREKFYHFGIDKDIMGKIKCTCSFDPIEKSITNNGSILVYTTKQSIYNRKVFEDFEKYISLCNEITDYSAKKYITQIKQFIGANDNKDLDRYSQMISMLKKGIVIHHGSLPLQARNLIEQFTQAGFCRICFSTSTLEQGINMPFDIVFLNTFKESEPLALKNLIGRAGRSTQNDKFDFGSIVVKLCNMPKLRNILKKQELLDNVSMLEKDVDEDLIEFKDAILEGTLSDEYNITETQLEKLKSEKSCIVIKKILDILFKNNKLVDFGGINEQQTNKLTICTCFQKLYEIYLGRNLCDGEKNIFNTAITNSYSYDSGDRISKITHNGFNYYFGYTEFGLLKSIKVGTQSLVNKSYNNKGILSSETYGNGQTIEYEYNDKNNKKTVKQDGNTLYSYDYDEYGTLTSVNDNVSGRITSYLTNEDGQDIIEETGSGIYHKFYSTKNGKVETIGEKTKSTNTTINDFSTVITYNVSYNGGTTHEKNTDKFGRIENEKVVIHGKAGASSDVYNKEYNYYAANNGNLTDKVSKISYSGAYDKTIEYGYDDCGNISKIDDIVYAYDKAGQLVTEVNALQRAGKEYVYDKGGNITEVKHIRYGMCWGTDTYTYGNSKWKDLLTAYNGNEITYDGIGNPLTYYNGIEFKWTMGRRLESAKNGNTKISYTYNADGLRTSKNVNDIKYDYYWNGDKLTAQTWQGNTMYFYYDNDGNPIGFDYNDDHYYYLTNLQGDIIAILSGSNVVAEYKYDAWGNCAIYKNTNSIADINPLRYRGYYYDTDTNLYYLQSRYYDGNIGRFINADEPLMISENFQQVLQENIFCYCLNNPISNIDSFGFFAWAIPMYSFGFSNAWNPLGWAIVAATTVSCVGVGVYAYASHRTTKNGSKKRTNDKHTKPRPGRSSEKKKQKDSWKRPR